MPTNNDRYTTIDYTRPGRQRRRVLRERQPAGTIPRMRMLLPVLVLWLALPVLAQSELPSPAASSSLAAEHASSAGHIADDEPHPTLSANAAWAREVGLVILALFLLAAGVGTLARLALPATQPDAAPAAPQGQPDGINHAGNHH
jgi:hypothetical protein